MGRDCPMGVGCPRSEHDDALGILKSPMELEEIISSAEIYQLTLLTLVNQSFKLSRAEDQRAVKPGGVIHGGETDGPRNRCSLRETRFLPPHLNLAERTCCCIFCF
jgi:hypothetical protein